MLRTTCIALALISLASALDAQTFQRTIGGLFDDRPNCVETTIDGGSIIAGDRSIVEYV
ncbi:MAG: hypothetical protein AAF488_00950 [Planctomycetota bacterium]